MAEDYQCPDCGSEGAVSKSVAWDALAKTPPKVERELAWLRNVANAAQTIVQHTGDKNMADVTIPAAVFDNVRAALQR